MTSNGLPTPLPTPYRLLPYSLSPSIGGEWVGSRKAASTKIESDARRRAPSSKKGPSNDYLWQAPTATDRR